LLNKNAPSNESFNRKSILCTVKPKFHCSDFNRNFPVEVMYSTCRYVCDKVTFQPMSSFKQICVLSCKLITLNKSHLDTLSLLKFFLGEQLGGRARCQGRKSQGANKPGGEPAKGRKSHNSRAREGHLSTCLPPFWRRPCDDTNNCRLSTVLKQLIHPINPKKHLQK